MKEPLIIIAGPTASGKTALSIRLAKAYDGEIISADSMQVYKGMDIGTAKIRPEEMQGVPHHLIDVLEPEVPFNVVTFQQMAKEAIRKIRQAGHLPIIVGGTGFYIQAVLYDIDFTKNDEDTSFREALEKQAESEEGRKALYEMLAAVDPDSAKAIHPNNIKRVIRAIEFNRQTGQTMSSHNAAQQQRESAYNSAFFVLDWPRQTLYSRIEKRVDLMIKAGLPEEVKGLKDRGLCADHISMQGLGYKEMLEYLDGQISLEEAADKIRLGTRHFAKRQLTWFRRERDVIWLPCDENTGEDALMDMISVHLKAKNII